MRIFWSQYKNILQLKKKSPKIHFQIPSREMFQTWDFGGVFQTRLYFPNTFILWDFKCLSFESFFFFFLSMSWICLMNSPWKQSHLIYKFNSLSIHMRNFILPQGIYLITINEIWNYIWALRPKFATHCFFFQWKFHKGFGMGTQQIFKADGIIQLATVAPIES